MYNIHGAIPVPPKPLLTHFPQTTTKWPEHLALPQALPVDETLFLNDMPAATENTRPHSVLPVFFPLLLPIAIARLWPVLTLWNGPDLSRK